MENQQGRHVENTSPHAGAVTLYMEVDYNAEEAVAYHGIADVIAKSNSDWLFKSAVVDKMQLFLFSGVFFGNETLSYYNHIDEFFTEDIPDLAVLHTDIQPPLYFLCIDPTIASAVRLEMHVAGNAIAAQSPIYGSTATLNSFTRYCVAGTLAFVGTAENATTLCHCDYGFFDDPTGTVIWDGSGVIALIYSEGIVSIIGTTGFPEEWTFNTPQLQGDGTWMIDITEQPEETECES